MEAQSSNCIPKSPLFVCNLYVIRFSSDHTHSRVSSHDIFYLMASPQSHGNTVPHHESTCMMTLAILGLPQQLSIGLHRRSRGGLRLLYIVHPCFKRRQFFHMRMRAHERTFFAITCYLQAGRGSGISCLHLPLSLKPQ